MTAVPRPMDEARLLPAADRPTAEVGWWAMVWFCATESTLFAYLIASYFYLGVSNPNWPPAGMENPKLPLPLAMTALLLASSATIHWAGRALRRGARGTFRVGLAATILLGLGFLALQAMEYREKLAHMSPVEHAYSAIFFTITGFHGAHVAFGVLFFLYIALLDARGYVSGRHHLVVKNASLYWHTVDGVWLAILTALYLSPRFY